jgi:hypothetical protein
MRCSRYRPISKGAMGRPPIYPAGFHPKEFNQRDLPDSITQDSKSLAAAGGRVVMRLGFSRFVPRATPAYMK